MAGDGPSWTVRFGGERIEAACIDTPHPADAAGADATVSGLSSDLYRWVWNRPSPVVVSGADDVAELWRRVRI